MCGGNILNNRAILTAAHCFMWFSSASQWRMRVGSTFASSGGSVHNVKEIINHPSFSLQTLDNDISILKSATAFIFSKQVRPGSIAGPNYKVADNQPVWSVGWGAQWFGGPDSEELQHVQIWTVNQYTCRERYAEIRLTVTDNMLCSGWLDVGGRDQCQGDSGGPLIHKGVVIGLSSWGEGCTQAKYPGVNARVSRYASWIRSNA